MKGTVHEWRAVHSQTRMGDVQKLMMARVFESKAKSQGK
jgi:hypothetical protein